MPLIKNDRISSAKRDKDWADNEARLWHKMMDPRTYARMVDDDGKPVAENKKVAYSWKLYQKWIEN